ncbi:uncharacterized protein Z520_06124 [Fonsecaea multimorphosa CBS 102226]|uniref:Arrestin-like N-terminal domain-containing protein n=1 Tax=Fonsecaea multimorphosa CBS 102226 TaxID=1442371 RepID=A0A0D2H861_9EURO|nr:uncharacterized protein Z520_06124 [Fonsecaea multimorphosa CBS 102226]KIX98045.1 hypothetical protein Z520_06124 [Fonsecaea multimorphosa CBS 102226]OAL24412.1 hypothetical protein AYO22_05788 [Fonsecaea multimorphosa]
MSTPTIRVLGVSAADEAALSVDDKVNAPSRLRLHGRISVFNQDGSFDTVRIRLQGAIHTRIGPQAAVEKIASTTIVKTNLDFKPAYSASRERTEEQYLDFVCPIPSSRRGAPDEFVPSMTLSGTTYLTKVTALTNREQLEGSCQVVYTLEAEFLRSPTKQVVRRISCPVDISSALTSLDVEVTSGGYSDHVEQIAKSQLRLDRFRGSQSQPKVSVHMPKLIGCAVNDFSTASTGCRRLTVPVSVNVAFPSQIRRQAQELLEKDSLRCSVTARWLTKRTFTTGSSAVESTVHSDRASTQKFAMTLPPLYKPNIETSKYTTSMELELLLPESISTPSVSTDLLKVSYTLDLSMRFEASGNDSLKGPYTANFSLPAVLRAAQPQSLISRRSFDPLLGLVEEQSVYAPPPYVY